MISNVKSSNKPGTLGYYARLTLCLVFLIRVSSLQTKDDERGPRTLPTTSRKKQESGFVPRSQDVLDAVTLENDEIGMMENACDFFIFIVVLCTQV